MVYHCDKAEEKTAKPAATDPELTHIGPGGDARMVDVGGKDITRRRARAGCRISMNERAFAALTGGNLPKGDAMCVARIAGIQAAKKTSDLIPLCHPLPLDHVAIDFIPDRHNRSVSVEAVVTTSSRTGVEMEALVAVSAAALALYDMVKAVDREMVISDVCLLEKSGGRRGHYVREGEVPRPNPDVSEKDSPEQKSSGASADSATGEVVAVSVSDRSGIPNQIVGEVVAVSVSEHKGVAKANVSLVHLEVGVGIKGDVHGGDHDRQVSLLAEESIDKVRAKGLDVPPGRMAENITTRGIVLHELELGTRFRLGDEAVVVLTKIGKECHNPCAIYHQVGDCVMPREGIFVKVCTPGTVKPGDKVEVLKD